MHPLLRRLLSPAGLVLAGLCLLLPFMTASCSGQPPHQVEWKVTWTGVDVVTGGRPDIAFTEDADKEPIRRIDDADVTKTLGELPVTLHRQPVAWLAVALMLAALAATALPSRAWRAPATAGLALAAGVVLWGAIVLARRDATDAVAAVLSQTGSPEPFMGTSDETQNAVRGSFRYLYGFWITLSVLAAVAVANIVEIARTPAAPISPAQADPGVEAGSV